MRRLSKLATVIVFILLLSGCYVTTENGKTVLKISFVPVHHYDHSWAAATVMAMSYHHAHYTQSELLEYYQDYYGFGSPDVYELSWILWDLAYLDSLVTGTLSLREVRDHINSGDLIILHYGDAFTRDYVVLHGYDSRGYVYLHEPHYGTRVVHYDDLYLRYLDGTALYWESSLIVY